jgi:ubiquinol-cytochrome c reductase iron-sulfur subunit
MRRRAESAVLALLGIGALAAGAFAVLYIVHPNTQLLGLSLGLALAALSAAAIVAGKRIVPQETIVEERPELVHEDEIEAIDELVKAGGEGVSRRRLLLGAAGAAGTALGAAVAVPVASLGPDPGKRIEATPWSRGRRLVDEHGKPISADDLEVGGFLTAYPEHGDVGQFYSPIVVLRVPVDQLDLPSSRAGWAPEGILAFSKICTHAGCAVSLYRKPTYQPTSKSPALVCPCHYSTFDVRRGGKVTFGPAGRALPQLPLRILPDRTLAANGGFSGDLGPSWPDVRRNS